MSVAPGLVVACLLLLMLLGIFIVVYALVRLVKSGYGGAKSDFSIPIGSKKIELKGPAWLVLVAIGVLMVASPVLAAYTQKYPDATVPSPSVQRVQENEDLPEEDNPAFVFISDLSILDLRQAQSVPWYTSFRHLFNPSKEERTKPAILRNVMVVRKTAQANDLVISYSTTGALIVRCLTHDATYKEKRVTQNGTTTDTWALTINVSAMPVNVDFEVIVEATYFDAFSDPNGSDYSTYGNKQPDPENLSVVLIFPDDKPMKSVHIKEFPPNHGPGTDFQGSARRRPEQGGGPTYYWTTTNSRSGYYYTLAWDW